MTSQRSDPLPAGTLGVVVLNGLLDESESLLDLPEWVTGKELLTVITYKHLASRL